MQSPLLVVVCGPNGVGTSSFVDDSRALSSPSKRSTASRPAAVAWRDFAPVTAMTSGFTTRTREWSTYAFAVETTLAGRRHERRILAARERGFRIEIFCLGVADVETCLARIARRVSAGGHDVPEADVRRRFPRSMAHLASAADSTIVYDSEAYGDPRRVLEFARARLAWAAPTIPPRARSAVVDLLPPSLGVQAPRHTPHSQRSRNVSAAERSSVNLF